MASATATNATAQEINAKTTTARLLAFGKFYSFVLKYSPSTALTVSGMDSSLRAFRSCSSALTISADMATIILFIKVHALYIGTHRNLYTFRTCIAMCGDRNMGFPKAVDEGRVMRGQAILKSGSQIKRLEGEVYQVNSQSGHGFYTVAKRN